MDGKRSSDTCVNWSQSHDLSSSARKGAPPQELGVAHSLHTNLAGTEIG
jgi:hypothetical protein